KEIDPVLKNEICISLFVLLKLILSRIEPKQNRLISKKHSPKKLSLNRIALKSIVLNQSCRRRNYANTKINRRTSVGKILG
ncbi:hypothetical protein ACJBT6_10365, partial [Streptococcus suis]